MDTSQIEMLKSAFDMLKIVRTLVEAARMIEKKDTTNTARRLLMIETMIDSLKYEINSMIEDDK